MRFGHSNTLPLADSAGRSRSSYIYLSYSSGPLVGGNEICFRLTVRGQATILLREATRFVSAALEY
jgi:hypothetical protein